MSFDDSWWHKVIKLICNSSPFFNIHVMWNTQNLQAEQKRFEEWKSQALLKRDFYISSTHPKMGQLNNRKTNKTYQRVLSKHPLRSWTCVQEVSKTSSLTHDLTYSHIHMSKCFKRYNSRILYVIFLASAIHLFVRIVGSPTSNKINKNDEHELEIGPLPIGLSFKLD